MAEYKVFIPYYIEVSLDADQFDCFDDAVEAVARMPKKEILEAVSAQVKKDSKRDELYGTIESVVLEYNEDSFVIEDYAYHATWTDNDCQEEK